jgi:WD40 repeat protein
MEPTRNPLLRIETGQHTAVIRRISTDAANRYLVTASEDKTARVWDLATGKLLRVLRPPLGAGDEGKLYAVALSPDGRTVAVGGLTGAEWSNNTTSIYHFDRESGRLVQRIAGLPNVVFHLVYAPQGEWLAATLGKGNGVRVYATGSYREVFADREYGAASFGADFDAAGRLVTTCDDGYLRLYEPAGGTWRLAAKCKAAGGDQPFTVRFAPDGQRVAVGFDDSTRVAVLSGRDLTPLFAPDTSGVDNGDLSKVAWTADGQTLAAGGRYDKDGQSPIRLWPEGGRGVFREVAAAANTVMDILPLRAGGLVYGAGGPGWGVLDARGQRTHWHGPALADYRGMLENFLLSGDGAVVQFGYEPFGKSPARFELRARRLATEFNENDTLAPPRTTGLAVSDWNNNTAPKLDGQPLTLLQYERSRSLAIAPNHTRFLLGAEFRLRLFDRRGKELWQVALPGVAWSVNISGDGKLAVAALSDGTIRWYRLTDGQELLAFFPYNGPEPDARQRWVLWTPSGYYDCAPGAEALIGWHVNNGPDHAADFFPASQFRDLFYRPDVINRILQTLDEDEAVRQADAATGQRQPKKVQPATVLNYLPPVVQMLLPHDGMAVRRSELTVYFTLRAPSNEPVTEVWALVDGRPVEAERHVAWTVGEQPQHLHVSLPEQDCELALLAKNQYTTSNPETRRLKWRGRVTPVSKPNLYLLAAGVSQYKNWEYNLDFAAKDARDFAAVMQRQQGLLYGKVETRLLTDKKATRDGVMDGLEWICQSAKSSDVAMVFLAGHGDNDQLVEPF